MQQKKDTYQTKEAVVSIFSDVRMGNALKLDDALSLVDDKQITFVERGLAQMPPRGAPDAALLSLETERTFVSSLRSVPPCQHSSPSPRNDCPQ